jgi:hypothetical protein
MPAFFPLRSNAYALMAGSSVADVRRRIKVAALLHDQVLIDAGSFYVTIGTAGATQFRFAPGQAPDEDWQTPQERGRAKGQEPLLLVDGQAIRQGKNLIYWQPTFEPFRQELLRAYPWIEFVELDLNQDGKNLVQRLVHEDERDSIPLRGITDQRVRQAILTHANTDAVLATSMDAAVNADRLHRQIYRARVEHGEAERVPGEGALLTLFPDVGELSWDDVDELRNHPDWRYLREFWQEIEIIARSEGNTPTEIAYQIHEEYESRLREAWRTALGSFTGKVVRAGYGVLLGTLSVPGPFGPLIANLATNAAGLAMEQLVIRANVPRWLAADDALWQARGRALTR